MNLHQNITPIVTLSYNDNTTQSKRNTYMHIK